jgi:hypothetical protein
MELLRQVNKGDQHEEQSSDKGAPNEEAEAWLSASDRELGA